MLARLRKACQAAGYTEEALRERLGDWTPVPGTEAVERRLLDGDDRLATLARLLLLGVPTGLSEAAAAVALASLDELVATGLLVTEGNEVRAPFRTAPHDDRLLVSDRQTARPDADVVIGVNPAALATAQLTPRRPVRSTLDLGTGGGIQALAAGGHSERVVGVDVNHRALAFAEVNACLNDMANVEWLEGNWLEPVDGRRFDLIVANHLPRFRLPLPRQRPNSGCPRPRADHGPPRASGGGWVGAGDAQLGPLQGGRLGPCDTELGGRLRLRRADPPAERPRPGRVLRGLELASAPGRRGRIRGGP